MLLACHKTTGSPAQYRRAARYADGVNQYIDELKQQIWELDPSVGVYMDPDRVQNWEAADSLAIGRLSWPCAVNPLNTRSSC